MRKYALIALALVLGCSMLTGCRRREPAADMTIPSTQTTRPATEPTTHKATEPMTHEATQPGDHAVVEPTTAPVTGDTTSPSDGTNAKNMPPESNMR